MLLMRDGVQPRGENYQWDSTKGQMAPEGARLLCRALRPTAEITHVLVSGRGCDKGVREARRGLNIDSKVLVSK